MKFTDFSINKIVQIYSTESTSDNINHGKYGIIKKLVMNVAIHPSYLKKLNNASS